MMRTLLLALLLTTASVAHATVYKCVDANGRVTYTNDSAIARACTPLNTDQAITSIPAPTRKPAGRAPASTGSGDFPRVSPDAQQERDTTRRQVLEKELQTEEQSLAKARESLASREAILQIKEHDENDGLRCRARREPQQ
ncbi:MAG: DUF4124 domain-containing protein [Rhodocyclales bacterium]|nr:DUF4124 domain-containing protein [Rhodocyclales bacterium]